MAPSPSGKAKVCKTFITSSNLVGASNFIYKVYLIAINKDNLNMPMWRNGRRKGLKIPRGETPVPVRVRPSAPT